MHEQLHFKKLHDEALLPTRGSRQAAGLDLYAVEGVIVPANGFKSVGTGIAAAIPDGFYGRIAPRSGLAAKHGIDTLAGVIDSDYRGELICVLSNLSGSDYEILAGDKIAQFVIESIIMPEPVWVDSLEETGRGQGGFGSTGYN
ncbi:MAG: dUTP diphosphatase [bacterium]|nr:dUTP diphosphatase [bacterium]